MGGLKKKLFTIGLAVIAGIACWAVTHGIAAPSLASSQAMLDQKRQTLEQIEMLLTRKQDYLSAWEGKKKYVQTGLGPEEALNLWVKELLAHASSQGIVFSKLEPQGFKEISGEKEIRLYVVFESDVRRFIRLLYYLKDQDPFTRVQAFGIKKNEETKNYSFELTLGKILL